MSLGKSVIIEYYCPVPKGVKCPWLVVILIALIIPGLKGSKHPHNTSQFYQWTASSLWKVTSDKDE